MDGTSILTKLEDVGRSGLTWIEHGAAYLVGAAAAAEQSLQSLEAASPLVKVAIDAGRAAAMSHGVPLDAIEGAGDAVLEAAKALAAGLTQTGTAAPTAATVVGGAS